jgi:hypothetical protein
MEERIREFRAGNEVIKGQKQGKTRITEKRQGKGG